MLLLDVVAIGRYQQELFCWPVRLAGSAPAGEVVPGVHLRPDLQATLQKGPTVNIQNLLALKSFSMENKTNWPHEGPSMKLILFA